MTMTFGITSPKALERMEKQLRQLGDKAESTKRRVFRRAADNMLNAFRFTAPVVSGATKKALGKKETYNKSKGDHSYWIGIRMDFVTYAPKTDKDKRKEIRLMLRNDPEARANLSNANVKKYPASYAWEVERKSIRHRFWFSTTWKLRRGEMAREIMAGVYDEVKKQLESV
jgi:hypothetical protein